MPTLCFNGLNQSPMRGADVRLPELAEAVAGAGFELIGLDRWAIEAYVAAGGTLDSLRALLDGHGLQCFEVVGLVIDDGDDTSVGSASDLAAMVDGLGAEYVLTVTDVPVTAEIVDRTGRCADVIGRAGGRLGFEFVPTRPVHSIAGAVDLCAAVGYDRAQVLLDTWHFFRGPDGWDDLEAMPLDALGYIQFNDAPPVLSDDLNHELQKRRVMPGQGEFDLAGFCSRVTAKGFDGVVSIEVLSDELRSMSPDVFAKMAMDTTRPLWLH